MNTAELQGNTPDENNRGESLEVLHLDLEPFQQVLRFTNRFRSRGSVERAPSQRNDCSSSRATYGC